MRKQKKHSSRKKIESEDPLAGDMGDFILDGIREGSWQVAKFELKETKNKVISLRLSEKLLHQVKRQAANMGIDTGKFIRLVLENTIRKKVG